MRYFPLNPTKAMSIPKSSWRKPPKSKKGAVIRTRPIFPAAFPAVKTHAIQRGSVRTICSRKWPNRTAKGGARAKLLPVPTHAPPGQSCDPCLLTNSNGDRGSYAHLGSQKAVSVSYTKAPAFAWLQKWGLIIRHRNRRQRSSYLARQNPEILPASY